MARTAALRARLITSADCAGAVAILTGIETRDRNFFHRAAHSIPKSNFDTIFEVAAGLFLLTVGGRGASGVSPAASNRVRACPR